MKTTDQIAEEAADAIVFHIETHHGKTGYAALGLDEVREVALAQIQTAIEEAVKDTAELAQWHDKARRRVEQQRDDELKANRKYRAYITQLKQHIGESDAKLIASRAAQAGEQ